MLTHIVFIRLREAARSRLDETRIMLLNMEGRVESLKSIEVGVDILHTERSYDLALITKFETLAGMQAYQVHPIHQNVLKHLKTVAESTVTVDFES